MSKRYGVSLPWAGGTTVPPIIRPMQAPPRTDGRRDDLRTWSALPPDYVGVGTARSGTSWWDHLISQHPDVVRAPGRPKELHFFDELWTGDLDDQAIERYHRHFMRPAGSVAGEWTPGYMLDAWTPALLRRAAPDARILV